MHERGSNGARAWVGVVGGCSVDDDAVVVVVVLDFDELPPDEPEEPEEPEPEPEDFPHIMGVTVKEPMKISGTMLMPGRYVFQLPDPGTQPNRVEIFNGDQTQLVANVILGGGHSPRDMWN